MYKVFIDGKEGTTGLQIYERLGKREDIEIITLSEELRKDKEARKKCINSADIVFLCLPDVASIESVSLVENEKVKIIDASTAHRTNKDWAYGFPELSSLHRQKIKDGNRVAVPGCHASGFISLVYPLIAGGFVAPDYPFVCHSITGYSGGGKKMIAEYESEDKDFRLNSPRQYGLGLTHKHIPEMTAVCNLSQKPIFNPIVSNYYSGMCVTVPIHTRLMTKKSTVEEIKKYFTEYYGQSNFIKVIEKDVLDRGFLSANDLCGTNNMQIYIDGNDEQILLASRFDNLGKGASGAAVQCMNIMLGLDEKTSLCE